MWAAPYGEIVGHDPKPAKGLYSAVAVYDAVTDWLNSWWQNDVVEGIVTTGEELEGFRIVRAIAVSEVEPWPDLISF